MVLGRLSMPPPAGYFEADQRVYLAMARSQPLSGAVAEPPFCWRPMLPMLVHASADDANAGFRGWMLLVLALLPPLTRAFLLAAGIGETSATIAGVTMAFAPAVSGYLSWDHVRPDGLSLLLILVAALCFVKQWRAGFLIGMVALALTKETWVIVAAFTLIWSRAMPARAFRLSVTGAVLALAVTVAVRFTIPPSEPYSLAANVRGLYWPFSLTVVARRAMLAVGSTWNVLGPLAAFAIARRIRLPNAWALAAAIALATGQVAVAIDTQRIVAAAYPFVLLACAWDLDRLGRRHQYLAGAAIVAAQLPWLLFYARVLPMSLRPADIALSVAAVAAAGAGLVQAVKSTSAPGDDHVRRPQVS
jgi:hypothetical protein